MDAVFWASMILLVIGLGLVVAWYVWPKPDSGTTKGRLKEVDKGFSINNSRPVLKHQQKRATAVRETVESKDRLKDALQNSDLREKHFNQGEELKDSEHRFEGKHRRCRLRS